VALAPPGSARPFFRAAIAAGAAYTVAVLAGAQFLGNVGLGATLFLGLAVGGGVAAAMAWHARAHVRVASGAEVVRPPPAPRVEDWERLLDVLAADASGRGLSRRDLADALGILPRNVQRVVDAANRSDRARPGVELVRAWYERGRRNQLEYRYALTPAGRAALAGATGRPAP
jgi:hypothetical protein